MTKEWTMELREAFAAGWEAHGGYKADGMDKARRKYPLPPMIEVRGQLAYRINPDTGDLETREQGYTEWMPVLAKDVLDVALFLAEKMEEK